MVFCVGRVYGADGAMRHHPHRTHELRSGSQDHHPFKNSVQKTTCCNSTSNAPDAKNISIKLPSCIKLAFQLIHSFLPTYCVTPGVPKRVAASCKFLKYLIKNLCMIIHYYVI